MGFNLTARLNPELVKSLRISLPGRRILFVSGSAIALVLIVIGLFWNSATGHRIPTSEQQLQRFGSDTYWALTVILFGVLFVLGPAATALSMVQEKLRGTSVFQQTVLLSPRELAVGKFLGSALVSYLVAIILMPFALAASVVGHEPPSAVVRLYLFLVIGGLCLQAVGLFVSSSIAGPAERHLKGGLLAGPGVGLLGAVAAVLLAHYFYATDLGELEGYKWGFYGHAVQAHEAILGLLVFVGACAFLGSVRRIKAGQLIPVGPLTLWLFLGVAEALLVGFLWGRSSGSSAINEIAFYLAFNWAALVILAGAFSMDRLRLREWWSAGDDPLSVLQRREIRNGLLTLLLALGLAEAGLVGLWISYHVSLAGLPSNASFASQLAPIAICFALTTIGSAAFIQYCAMRKFRLKGGAGVALAVVFYFLAGVAGTLFASDNNVPALLNPVIYATTLCERDIYVDPRPTFKTQYVAGRARDVEKLVTPDAEKARSVLVNGLVSEGLLAAACVGLAYGKFRKTREEIFEDERP